MKKIQSKKNKNSFAESKFNKGFTILELMVAITLFLVVVLSGISSLVGTTFSLNRSSKATALIDNLSFIMEDMARNIRTGEAYSCDINNSEANSCPGGSTDFSFDESISGDRWAYSIDTTEGDSHIYKSDNGSSVELINSPEIQIQDGSGFYVYGAEAPNQDGSGDDRQPFVVIRLIGKINYKGEDIPFNLQTSASQMSMDLYYE